MNNTLSQKIGSIFSLCNKTKFPGTLASFVAFLASFFVYYFSNGIVYLMLFLALVYFSFWSIKKIQEEKGTGDHQFIGIDEVLGMWIANLFLFQEQFSFSATFFLALMSFTIFRIFDISKIVPPLKSINNNKNQNALQVIMDDVVAGIYTYFVMLIILNIYNINYLYLSLLVLLPAMIANMTPTVFKLNILNYPINKGIFGKNKTWRGFIFAIIFGTITYIILNKLNLILISEDKNYVVFIGFMSALGAIGGDLVKSFFKRKSNIAPGENFSPFDQVDYVIGMILLTYPFFKYDLSQIMFLLILGGWISAIAHRIGWWLKLNSQKQ